MLALDPESYDLVIHALCPALGERSRRPAGAVPPRAATRRAVPRRDVRRADPVRTARRPGRSRGAAVRAASRPASLPMGEIRDLGGLLQRAGLCLPVADGFARRQLPRPAFHLMRRSARDGRGQRAGRPAPPSHCPAAFRARRRRGSIRRHFRHARWPHSRHLRDDLSSPAGSPHESQQKPLRPGSAAHGWQRRLQSEDLPPASADGTSD